MFFSVIITTYGNRTEKLKRAINSVLNQSFKDFEIIIVDDNGNNLEIKNKNRELIENLNFDKKIKYFTYTENKGANFARNFGIKNCQGKYIAFLDDDDEFIPDKLKFVYEEIMKEEIGLIYSNVNYIDDLKNYIEEKKYYDEKKSKKEILKRNFIGPTSAVILNKNILNEVGTFNEELKSCQDWEMWIRVIFCNKKIKKINKALIFCYVDREEKTRITNNYNGKLQGHKKVFEIIKSNYLNNFSEEDKEEILYYQKMGIVTTHYTNFNFKKYRKEFREIYSFKHFLLKDYVRYFFSFFNILITSKGILKNKNTERGKKRWKNIFI